LGPVSPMDRPDPTKTNRPQAGGGTAPSKRVQTPASHEVSAACEPIRPLTVDEARRGKCVPGENKMKHFCVDLKVCEGCGGLWLRAQNGNMQHGVYCRSCALLLSEFPAPRQRSRAGRKPKVRLAVCQGGTK
jgi:hypothetical protein